MPAPLTPEQRVKLKANIALPLTVVAISVVPIIAASLCMAFGFVQATLFKIFLVIVAALIVAVIGALSKHIYNNVMDLRDGLAEIGKARLTSKKRVSSTRSAAPTYYADFDGLGVFTISKEIYEALEEGQFCRVVYAPRARVVFEARML